MPKPKRPDKWAAVDDEGLEAVRAAVKELGHDDPAHVLITRRGVLVVNLDGTGRTYAGMSMPKAADVALHHAEQKLPSRRPLRVRFVPPVPDPVWVSGEADPPRGPVEPYAGACPRCGAELAATAFHGPCATCRRQLRKTIAGESRHIVVEYVPKTNVTANAVAQRDDSLDDLYAALKDDADDLRTLGDAYALGGYEGVDDADDGQVDPL